MTQPGYLRQPTVAGDTLVFICDDDLWTVGIAGGAARRLTAGLAEPSTPALSADGKWLAYVSRDESHPEVYLMPAGGGPARRMTWSGPDVQVRGFTPDGRILFVSTAGQPFIRNNRAYTLALDGGLPELLPLGQVNHLSFGAGGRRVIGRNTADPARWKRYRGGTAGHLWVDPDGHGEFKRLTALSGNLTCPLWIGERIYFLGDSDGCGNLYSCTPIGTDVRRHTDRHDFYARHASTDGRRIVYACGADLYLFDVASGHTQRLEIEVPGHRTQAARRFVSAADFLHSATVHPQGHSVALDVRGKLATMALWEGAVRQVGATETGRLRHAAWLADGTTLIATSDSSGDERLVTWTDGVQRVIDHDIGRVIRLLPAPNGTRVALTNHRNEVLLADVASGSVSVLDRSPGNRIEELAWSPDGAWLAYPHWPDIRRCAIKLAQAASGHTQYVTPADFRDYAPAFDPDGKYLYFLSVRTFDPVYDNANFDLSFPRAARPYLIALAADAAPPFERVPKGFGNGDKKSDESKSTASAGSAPIRVDLDGIGDRVAAFPVAEGRYGQIAGVSRGSTGGDGARVLWSVFPIPGAHGRGGHRESPARIESFDFSSGTAETWLDAADHFSVADDGVTVLVREGKRLRALDGTKKPESGSECNRKTGWLDLGRVRVDIDPRAEWRQMLREVWRLQRDQFWVADMSGIDWPAVHARYAPLVERVATRGELSDLIWELQGELGTSHAYEMGGDHRRAPALTLGQLAADLSWDDTQGGYAIRRLVHGDTWDATADSPLNAVGVQAQVGERIVAVNGVAVTRELPPSALLVNRAAQKVELTLARAETTRTVLVTTLADDVPAHYREWVERNRAWVHEASAQRVGYLHLPDMQAAGFAEFHRYFAGECDRPGLVIDLRYNRGGHVSQLLLEKLARRRLGYDLSRHNPPSPYPVESRLGPCVALTNEHAGSDGDIFSHCFKLMKLGPLIGTRTWGGVIGIWPRHKLADGTETTQPEFSFWFEDVGFAVENYGTDPDIEIDNTPQDAAAGRDAQLARAVEVALAEVERAQPRIPDFGPRPNLARK